MKKEELNEEQKVLKWRLKEQPTAENLQKLVEAQIISKEEAKQIILDEGNVKSSDIDDLKNEIGLLRQLVLELSQKNPHTITIIKEVVKNPSWTWSFPYIAWTDSSNFINC